VKLEFELPFEPNSQLYMIRKEYVQCVYCPRNKTGTCRGKCPRSYKIVAVIPKDLVCSFQTMTPRVVVRTVDPPFETFTLGLEELYLEKSDAERVQSGLEK
jgi:hypothetical protein